MLIHILHVSFLHPIRWWRFIGGWFSRQMLFLAMPPTKLMTSVLWSNFKPSFVHTSCGLIVSIDGCFESSHLQRDREHAIPVRMTSDRNSSQNSRRLPILNYAVTLYCVAYCSRVLCAFLKTWVVTHVMSLDQGNRPASAFRSVVCLQIGTWKMHYTCWSQSKLKKTISLWKTCRCTHVLVWSWRQWFKCHCTNGFINRIVYTHWNQGRK